MPFAPINGTQLHYHVTGRGVPIVFIHPPLLNQETFNYQRAQLSDDYKVVTFDIRGHGHSPFSQAPLSYPLIAEDIKQLLDFLEIDRAILCGYSSGGSIALEAMLTHPERFVGAVLVSAMSEASGVVVRNRIKLATGLSAIRGKRILSSIIGWGNADMNTTFNNLYKGAVQGDIRNIHQYYSYSLTHNVTDRLTDIRHPVLLLYGDKDTHFHHHAHLLNERLRNSTLRFIPDANHYIPTKWPRSMAHHMREWMETTFMEEQSESRREAFIQDIPDFLPDADTPSAEKNLQEL